MIEIVAARPTHVGPIANRMRETDRLEVSIGSSTPKNALRWGLMMGSAYTILADGQPIGMFGIIDTSLMTAKGRIWALFTEEAMKHPRAFLVQGPQIIKVLTQRYRLLTNYVHADNRAAIRWLKRMGFTVKGVEHVNGHPMRMIELCVTRQP